MRWVLIAALIALPAAAATDGLAALCAQVEECLLARFQEKDVPRTDYAVLLATRYRHALRDVRAGRLAGVEAVLAEVLARGRDATPARRRPFERVAAGELPRFEDGGDRSGLARALRIARRRLSGGGTVVFGTGRVRAADVARGVDQLLAVVGAGGDVDAAIREGFDVYRSPGAFGTGEVLFTAYASPIYEGARAPGERHRHPLYRSPKRAGLSPRALDRAAIYAGGLDGKKLEFAWLASRMDEYQIQIEGSGFVRLPDGSYVHAQYADQNGRGYQSLGKALVKDGVFQPWDIDNLSVRRYFREHPELERPYLEKNPSFVFFHATPLTDLPASEWLVDERTAAADRTVFARGQVGFADTFAPVYDASGRLTGRRPWRRFVVADDVGGAIKGAGRMDLYQGKGEQAQLLADTMKEPGALYLLVPKGTRVE